MTDILDLITGITEKERKKLLNWVASRTEETIIDIFSSGVKKSFQLKEVRPDIPGRIIKYGAVLDN